MATIRDIAKLTGLSVGTVSNVLNNVSTVTEENREKVNQAIAQLGYRRNQVASQLRSNISHTVGLVLPDISNPYYPEIARGVEDMARKRGYNTFLCNKDRSATTELKVVDALLGKQVDGILLFKPQMSAQRLIELHQQCPLVLFDVDPQIVTCDTVNVDNYKGMYAAVEQVIRLGHRRIAFLCGSNNSVSDSRRLDAFYAAVQDHNITIPEEYIQRCGYSAQSSHLATIKLLSMPEPPTAIIAANDIMAMAAMKAASEMGLSIPDDLSIIGYDDIINAELFGLTTTWHPKREMGELAVQLLIEQINARKHGGILKQQHIVMATELRIRNTLGAVRNK